MEPKERVIRAIEFSGPDRPPVMHWTLPGTYRVYGAQLEALYNRYPSDVLRSRASGWACRPGWSRTNGECVGTI